MYVINACTHMILMSKDMMLNEYFRIFSLDQFGSS